MERPFAPAKRAQPRTYGSRGSKRNRLEEDERVMSRRDGTSSRGRQDPSPSHNKTPSPLPEASTSHAATSRPRTPQSAGSAGSAVTFARSPGSAPVTPRKAASTRTTPTSSPTVKLDLGVDVFELLSPKREKEKRMNSRRFGVESDETEEDETESILTSRSNYASCIPSRNSASSRMAPRKPKPTSRAASPSGLAPVNLQSAPPVLSPRRAASKKGWPSSASVVLSSHGRRMMRTYGSQEDQQVQMHRATLQHAEHPFVEAAAPLDVNAMKARWDSLDEMESGGEEEEMAIKSITNLRSTGGNRRFLEEFDYLVMEISPAQRLGARQSTCVEIVKRVMGLTEEAECLHDLANDHSWRPPPVTSTPFLASLRAADVVEHLCKKLNDAREGHKGDLVVDLAIALIYARLTADPSILPTLVASQLFLGSLCGLIEGEYTMPKKWDRRLASLQRLAVAAELVTEFCEYPSPNLVATHAAVALLSNMAKPIEENMITDVVDGPNHGQGPLKDLLWRRLENAASTLQHRGVTSRTPVVQSHGSTMALVDTTALAISLMQDWTSALTVGRMTWASTILSIINFSSSCLVETGQCSSFGAADALSSCLRLLVVLTHSEDVHNCQALLTERKAATDIARLICKTGTVSAQLPPDELHRARLLDMTALALGILTNLLEKATAQTRACLLAVARSADDTEESVVASLGRLFWQHSQHEEDADEQTAIFCGCLAVALSLLLLGPNEEDDGAPQQDKLLLEIELSKGMALADHTGLRTTLADRLDRFASQTASILAEQQASEHAPEHAPIHPSADTQSITNEKRLVQQLSLRLRLPA